MHHLPFFLPPSSPASCLPKALRLGNPHLFFKDYLLSWGGQRKGIVVIVIGKSHKPHRLLPLLSAPSPTPAPQQKVRSVRSPREGAFASAGPGPRMRTVLTARGRDRGELPPALHPGCIAMASRASDRSWGDKA